MDNVIKAAKLMEEATSLLKNGPLEFYLKELTSSYALLMDRFAPFKVGDRVVLASTPDIDTGSGWYHARHFLLEGEAGRVETAECGAKGFVFGVVFDNESWTDNKGDKHQHKEGDRHQYLFRAHMLAAAQPGASAVPVDERAGQPTADAKDAECGLPPAGWHCTRGKGHEGPCAAVPFVECVSKQWCAANPGAAAHMIHVMAKEIDAARAALAAPQAVPVDDRASKEPK